jgi:hypothetical protein
MTTTPCYRHCSISAASAHEQKQAMSLAIPGLRDIHLPASPGWWPPAPGWWLLAGLLILGLAWSLRRIQRTIRLKRRMENAMREFDEMVAFATTAPDRIGAASGLLRRAAKSRNPSIVSLDGEGWMRFLDGEDPSRPFSQGEGAVLRDGAFQRTLDRDIAPAMALARARFAALLEQEFQELAHA